VELCLIPEVNCPLFWLKDISEYEDSEKEDNGMSSGPRNLRPETIVYFKIFRRPGGTGTGLALKNVTVWACLEKRTQTDEILKWADFQKVQIEIS
jgi:hypothetical protein